MTLPPLFIELVAGPPAAGKSTYAEAKRQLLVASSKNMDPETYGDRHLIHVNLDPANDGIFPYPCVIDICDLIEVKKVIEEENLGPNGSLLFCIEYLASHSDWLLEKMTTEAKKCASRDRVARRRIRPVWFLVDCPGQVEFYIHSTGLATLVRAFVKKLRAQVSLTHLCDSTVATRDVFGYVSTCLLCLTSMTDIELPQINVLTKWDRAREQAKDLMMLNRTIEEQENNNNNNKMEIKIEEKQNTKMKQMPQIPHVPAPDEDEIEEWLHPFCNASVFSSDHFEQMWKETQLEDAQKSQASLRGAMMRRCGGKTSSSSSSNSAAAAHSNTNDSNNSQQLQQQEEKEKEKERELGEETTTTTKIKGRNLKALTKTILDVIEGYNLVGYHCLDVQDGQMMQELCLEIDNAIGFQYHHGMN